MCVTDPHDMTLAVKVALNPNLTNTTNQLILTLIIYAKIFLRIKRKCLQEWSVGSGRTF